MSKKTKKEAKLTELTRFEPDTHQTPDAKNGALANLLQVDWNDLAIVRIDRIEIGSQQGWRCTYRP